MSRCRTATFTLRPTTLVLLLALNTAALSTAHAQTGAPQSYHLPAAPLSTTLNKISRDAGLALAVDSGLVGNRQGAPVRGQLSPEQALNAALVGSGLELVRTAAGTYTLRKLPTASSGEAMLAPVTVSAGAVRDGTTEGTGSYTTNASRTATKLNLSPRETPQTLTVVTRQKMDDFALTNIDNVLESSSTVAVRWRGGDGSAYFSRGFALQSQFDGIPNPIGIGESNRGPTPDTAFLDKVEILQGASGLMAGAGDPGGTINLVRKRPTEQFQSHIEAQLGSWNKKRLVGDVSGSLIDSGRVRGRVVALVDHSDSFTDHVYDSKQGIYGIVEADLTTSTTVSASVMYQKNDFNMHYGVPMGPNGADLGLPRSSFYGVGGGDSTKESTSYTLSLDQKLPADWLLKAAYTHSDISGDNVVNNLLGTLNPITGNGLGIWHRLQQREIKSDVADIYASGPVDMFGRKHELVFGASAAKMQDRSRLTAAVTTPLNIYSYDGASVSRPSGTFPDWPTPDETTQRGIYGAARLNLTDSLKAIVGTRVSWYEYKAAGVQKQKDDAVVSPYAGLVYDLTQSTSVYASYSDIFKPQSNLQFGGGTIDPIVGKNYELGVKSEFLQGRLNASAAVFRLEQTNLAQADSSVSTTACNGGQCYTAAGLVVSKGIDLGINGALTSNWQVGAGYTYVENEYGHGTGANVGKPYLTYVPRNIFRVHTTYKLPGTDWTVGGNVRAQSGMYNEGTSFRVNQGGFAVVGLMAKYQINKKTELGMVVNNLFDRRYYEAIGNGGAGTFLGNFYGAPRSFVVNLKYTF